MAGSLNKVEIIGNLGADPEVRAFQSGDKVANLRVATSEKWKDRDGNAQERTEWHSVAVFGKLAEIVERYLKKGSKVYLSGQLQTRKWQDQAGNDRYSTEIVLRPFNGDMIMLDGAQGRQDGQGGGSRGGDSWGGGRSAANDSWGRSGGGSASGGSTSGRSGGGFGDDLDDDIPF